MECWSTDESITKWSIQWTQRLPPRYRHARQQHQFHQDVLKTKLTDQGQSSQKEVRMMGRWLKGTRHCEQHHTCPRGIATRNNSWIPWHRTHGTVSHEGEKDHTRGKKTLKGRTSIHVLWGFKVFCGKLSKTVEGSMRTSGNQPIQGRSGKGKG
jgi:hypothetical protein